MVTKTVQTFRHRGFQPAEADAEVIMMFGSDPEPMNTDGSVMKKLWDHDHIQHTTVQNHVEPVDAGTISDPVPASGAI